MNELEANRDPGDETGVPILEPPFPARARVRGADDPECTCGGGHTVHESNAGGHSSSCPLWGQTWEGWPS